MSLNTIMSICMLAVFALLGGGLWQVIKGDNRKQGWLMLLLAIVIAANVAILAMPVRG